MQNTDLVKGLDLVRQACALDHASYSKDAIPLYKSSIIHFNSALQSSDIDSNTKSLIKQQIQIYSNRVAEIETQLNQQKRDILSVVTPSGNVVDDEDRILQERLAKLKANPPPTTVAPVQDKDLNDRFVKLTGRQATSSIKAEINYEDPPEIEQVDSIISQVLEDVRLDAITPGVYKEKKEKKEKKKKSKKSKKKKRHSSDSESESSSSDDSESESSESEEEDKSLEIKDTDSDFKKREKMALKKMFDEEKIRKAKAYEEWKKNQFKF